ncbi:MAG: hypothetical protein A2204_05935 [Elusimicrobia bacterium RIFOXYA1_FULL_47_7]|nr:MAG: hypothetical protein A2204_05935 [Elusimicrobia bacterium RIFOXYA1_FULL_47_7]
MECNKARELMLSDYMDGMLNKETSGEVEKHIASCQSCAGYYRSAVSAFVPFRKSRALGVPPAVWEGIRGRLAAVPEDEQAFNIKSMFEIFHSKLANAAVFTSMLLLTLFAGTYFAENMASSANSRLRQAPEEFASNIGFSEFEDMPGDQSKNVFSIIGG